MRKYTLKERLDYYKTVEQYLLRSLRKTQVRIKKLQEEFEKNRLIDDMNIRIE